MSRRQFGKCRQLPSKRWQASYASPTGSGKRIKAPSTFPTRTAAEGWLADTKRQIDAALWNPLVAMPVEKVIFGAYAKRWMAQKKASCRPGTMHLYTSRLHRYLLPEFSTLPLASITPAAVRDWHAGLAGAPPTMRAGAYTLLANIMRAALEDELIVANPCRIKGAGVTRRARPIRPATVTELAVITEHMPERLRLGVALSSWCALRFGEVTELRRHDIDLDAELIRVRRQVVRVNGGYVVGPPKTSAGVRDVSIPPHLIEPIREHLDTWCPEPDSLVLTGPEGQRMSSPGLWYLFDRARKAAGRPDLRWHDLRHTGAVMAGVAGATLPELMARLGHTTVDAAMVYQHAARSRDRELAALLSKMAAG